MGDGHHAWAAAEWVAILRNSFVCEENDRLIIGRGIRAEWLMQEKPLTLNSALTLLGLVSITNDPQYQHTSTHQVTLNAHWHNDAAPDIQVMLPGCYPAMIKPGERSVTVRRHRFT